MFPTITQTTVHTTMKTSIPLLPAVILALLLFHTPLPAQEKKAATLDDILPCRGLAIEAPSREGLDAFVRFIEEDLAPAHINLLILRVDWNYKYKTHPELRDENPLTGKDAGKIVKVCRKYGIRIAPQINLLGHQSWAKKTGALLREYPQFDETPSVRTEDYDKWPNRWGLYCKSYCPLHPDVHKVIFPLIDEICDAFEADAFHAGMDEVFYIGEKECPRCAGRDKAELFAGEVRAIRDHLASKGRTLMIWGDRLLDGRTTGLGEWEASYNGTWKAVDMIPRDVMICDWHYERAELSGVYFAMKGLDVAECGYRRPDVCSRQISDMVRFRAQSSGEVSSHLRGYIHTIWSGADRFLSALGDLKSGKGDPERDSDAAALIRVLADMKDLYDSISRQASE